MFYYSEMISRETTNRYPFGERIQKVGHTLIAIGALSLGGYLVSDTIGAVIDPVEPASNSITLDIQDEPAYLSGEQSDQDGATMPRDIYLGIAAACIGTGLLVYVVNDTDLNGAVR